MSYTVFTDGCSNLPGRLLSELDIRVLPCSYVLDGEPGIYDGDIDAFTNMLWDNLNEANKISLFVRYTDLATGEYQQRIINKHQ